MLKIIFGKLYLENFSTFFTDKDSKYSPSQVEQSLGYLKAYDMLSLANLFESEIESLSNKVLLETLEYAKNKLTFSQKSMQELLYHLDPSKKVFLPPHPTTYLSTLPRPFTLTVNEAFSVLGMWLLPYLNKAFLQEITQVFSSRVREKVEVFIQNTNFKKDHSHFPLVTLDSWLNDKGELKEFTFENYIRRFGDDNSITVEHYKHVVAYPFIQAELQKTMHQAVHQVRDQHYSLISSQILNAVGDKLKLANFPICFNQYENYSLQLFSNARLSDQSVEKLFTDNFVCFTNGQPTSTLSGSRFCSYFESRVTSQILENYARALLCNTNVKTALILLKKLEAMKHATINVILQNYLATYNEIEFSFGLLSLFDNFEKNFNDLETKYNHTIKSTIKALMGGSYTPGEVTPGSFTCLVRPTLCSLLGIDTDAILTPSSAKEIDAQILELRTKQERNTIVRESQLLVLPISKTIPVTYNKSLTPELLINLIAYWYYCDSMKITLSISLLFKNEIPPVIMECIRLVNNYYRGQDISTEKLRKLLEDTQENQLQWFSSKDATEQIAASLLNTKEIAVGEFVSTPLTFSTLIPLLQGKVVTAKKRPNKIRITMEEFNAKVAEEYLARKAEQEKDHAELLTDIQNGKEEIEEDESIEPQEIYMSDIKSDLLKLYHVEGMEEIPSLTHGELERKVIEEFRRQNRLAIEKNEKQKKLSPLSADQLKPKFIDLNEVRKELKKHYNIVKEEKKEEAIVTSISREQLERSTFQNIFTFFGNTPLDSILPLLKARHGEDDHLDENDLERLRLLLKEKWYKLYLKEKDRALYHYLQEKPNSVDSQYIAMADILAQYYRKKGLISFKYDLLMPGYFISPANLKAHTFPVAIIELLNKIGKDDRLYDFKNGITTNLNIELNVDDIPLKNLVITRSGYPLDINWIIQAYISDKTLNNPYTGNELTFGEIDDICSHPLGRQIIKLVMDNCYRHMSPKLIDLLEEYIRGTVFKRGFEKNYTSSQQRKCELAAQKFDDALREFPIEERDILMNETIPLNQYGHTVQFILKKSQNDCVTYEGLQLARVVVAYKRDKTNLPSFILDKVEHMPVRKFYEAGESTMEGSALERYIFDMYEKNPSVLKI